MEYKPVVSVIMPVYNSEKYLAEAIESILNQTFTNFEFLIFDDGSTDRSKAIIAQFVAKDRRIIAHYADINAGYVVHLNAGIGKARGKFIARMDSDDVALPNRFEDQVNFMNINPGIGILGSSSYVIEKEGKIVETSIRKTSSAYLFWQTFFTSPFSHPTVLVRKEIFAEVGLYNSDKMPAEDFDLWTRALPYTDFGNIRSPLLKYRTHENSISNKRNQLQQDKSIVIIQNLWNGQFGINSNIEIAKFAGRFHLGHDQLPPILAAETFKYLVLLYKMTTRRFAIHDEIKKDFFEKGLYLISKARRTRRLDYINMTTILFFKCPVQSVKALFHFLIR